MVRGIYSERHAMALLAGAFYGTVYRLTFMVQARHKTTKA